MNLVFIGSVVDKGLLKNFPDASVAGNKMQNGFIDGLKANGVNIEVVTVLPIATWRFNKKPIKIKSHKLIFRGVVHYVVGYWNFPVIKQLMIKRNIKRCLKKFCRTHISEDNFLIVYNTMSFIATPLFEISKKYKCKTLGIIADLPIQEKKSLIRRIEDQKQISLIAKFDALIPLTQLIQTDFAPCLPYLVIDAGCNPDDYLHIKKEGFFDNNVKNILYSGSLNNLSGIDLALDSLSLIHRQDVRLYIFGGGENEQLVKETSKHDSRIKYCGVVDNETILKLQMEADLLLCPRKSDDFTTKYTFPSKVLEYMCSGTPVICNRLQGIDREYEKYINFTEEESANSWAKLIERILFSDSELYKEKANLAKDFALKNKSWVNQCKDLIEFINSLLRNEEING